MHYPSVSQAVSGMHKPNKDISAAVHRGNRAAKSHLLPKHQEKWDLEPYNPTFPLKNTSLEF